MTPKEIVAELDKYIIGQDEAKKSVAIALRNRYRRSLLPEEIREEITPKNILMMGPTGCGKSTCVQLIPRFYDVTSGKVTVFGKDVKDYTKLDLLNKIGSVPQKAVVFQGSIRDNLKLGNAEASDEELWKALEIAQAKNVVEELTGHPYQDAWPKQPVI